MHLRLACPPFLTEVGGVAAGLFWFLRKVGRV
jgi:hypothetical protein